MAADLRGGQRGHSAEVDKIRKKAWRPAGWHASESFNWCAVMVGRDLGSFAKKRCLSISIAIKHRRHVRCGACRNNLTALLVRYRNVGDKAFTQRGLPTSFSVGNGFPICFSPLNKASIDIPRFDARRLS
jgi:hypothetical protein